MKRIALALLVVAGSAHAQWAKEPQAVFGIQLGKPAAESDIPPCPTYDRASGYGTMLCFEETRANHKFVRNLPFRDLGIGGAVMLTNGKVRAVHLDFNQADYARVRAMLVERYGAPQKAEMQTVKNGAGAVLTSEMVEWIGKENSLTLLERVGRVDKSAAAFTNNELIKAETAAQKEATAKDAAKF